MARTAKPVPLEIGQYIGERLVEWSIFRPAKGGQTIRFRFTKPQGLKVGDFVLYYFWSPYSRLPVLLELKVIEVEDESEGEYPRGAYIYSEASSTQVTKWPPGPGYSVG